MGASVAMRLVVLVGDSRVRSMWWDKASSSRRALWLVAIALRIGGVMALLYVAVRNLAG
jgi:hypothetical protein